MICPNCQTPNDPENVFCVACGATFSQTLPPTQVYQNPPPTQYHSSAKSEETAVLPSHQFDPAMANFTPSAPYAGAAQGGKNKKLGVMIGAIAGLFLLIGVVVAVILLWNPARAETLPEHLGMFVQNAGKDKVSEIKKQDFTNAVEASEKLLKDDSLAVAEENPNLILYSDGKEISLSDLRLIRLDTVKADGNLKQLDFQAAPVENKPEMKRIRIPGGFANGKYAFAVLDGNLDDGKHKFWAFEVKNSGKSSDSDLKSMTVSIKSKDEKTNTNSNSTTVPTQPRPPTPPPPVGSYAQSTSNDVILRTEPILNPAYDTKVRLFKGQRVQVLSHSVKTDTWKGRTGYWAYVLTDYGDRGWVFAPLIR